MGASVVRDLLKGEVQEEVKKMSKAVIKLICCWLLTSPLLAKLTDAAVLSEEIEEKPDFYSDGTPNAYRWPVYYAGYGKRMGMDKRAPASDMLMRLDKRAP